MAKLPTLPKLQSLSKQMPLKTVILVSGNGSNLQILIDAMQAGELPIDIIGVISNNEQAYAIERAQQANIDVVVLSHVASGKRMSIKTFEKHALTQLNDWQPDLIILAGFMRVLSGDFIANAPAPMINLHPSLLPKYKGLDTHARVLQAKEPLHGCSIHLVTAELDAGQVLTQAILPTNHQQTAEQLQKQVQILEHQLLPWTVSLIAHQQIDLANLNRLTDTQHFLPKLPWRLYFDE